MSQVLLRRAAGATFPSGVAQSIRNSLISWWDFEQSSGFLFNDSHGSNNLTPAFDAGFVSTASGKVGRAMEVGTTSEFAFVNNSATFAFGNQSFTHFLWHFRSSADNPVPGALKSLAGKYYPNTNQRSYMVGVNGGSPDLYRALISSDGTSATLTTLDGPEYIQSSSGWDFIAYGYDATLDQMFLIVNGTKSTASQSLGPFAASSAMFSIGAQALNGSTTNIAGLGAYDSAGVMNSAITTDQYNLLYNGGAGLNYAGLLAIP